MQSTVSTYQRSAAEALQSKVYHLPTCDDFVPKLSVAANSIVKCFYLPRKEAAHVANENQNVEHRNGVGGDPYRVVLMV